MSASTLVLGSVLASFFNDHLKIQKGTAAQLDHELR